MPYALSTPHPEAHTPLATPSKVVALLVHPKHARMTLGLWIHPLSMAFDMTKAGGENVHFLPPHSFHGEASLAMNN